MKKKLALLLAITMIFSLVSCRGKKEEETRIKLYPVDVERASLEHMGAIATQQYIIARLKTEALLEYDFEEGDIDELKVLTEEALEAWRLSQHASDQVEELVDFAHYLASASSKKLVARTYINFQPKMVDFFTRPVYADGKDSALKWAKDLTEKFDSYPMGQKIKGLAEELGTDAKRAFAQLKIAQDILQGDIYTSEADIMENYEKAAKATNAACKTILYTAGVVTGGGVANGLIEAGGIFIGGIDTLLTVTEAGAHIFLGENSKVTITAQAYQEVVGPISAVVGGLGLFTGDSIRAGLEIGADFATELGSLDKISYITESIGELFNEGTILGGLFEVGWDGTTSVKIEEISLEGKEAEQVVKEIKEAGLPLPEEGESENITELADKMEARGYLSEEEINEIIDNLREVLYEAFLDDQLEDEDIDDIDDELEIEPPISLGGAPSIDEVAGSYISTVRWADEEKVDNNYIFTKNEKGQLVVDGGPVLNYDQKSGIATHYDENENYRTEIYFKFTKEVDGIYFTGTMKLIAQEEGVFYMEGFKSN